jgi:hypothetical protein
MARSGRLAGVSDTELKAELERRQREAYRPPEPLLRPNMDGIVRLAKELVQQHAEKRDDDDMDHWCFEAVMQAVYGTGIWEWWNRIGSSR